MKKSKILSVFITTVLIMNHLSIPIFAIDNEIKEESTIEKKVESNQTEKDENEIQKTNQEVETIKEEQILDKQQSDEKEIKNIEKEEIKEIEDTEETEQIEEKKEGEISPSKIQINKNLFTESITETDKTSEEPYLEETEVNLYAVNPKLLEASPELAIPANYNTEYKIEVKGTDTPASQMYFYTRDLNSGEYKSPYYFEIDKSTQTIKPNQNNRYGSDYACVRVDGIELKIKVNVIDYSYEYVDNQLKQYVSQNLNNMKDLQKAETITKYVAEEYDYSGEHQSYRDMFLYKCGDCWGSANLINKISELAGIKSHTRNANQDPGAGSGHENNAFLINGKVYVGDAGYGTKKPREYSFYIEEPAFSYRTNKDGTIRITQYDGFEEDTLIVPSTIDGKVVTTIARGFITSNTIRAKKIVLPDTITTIEGYAFWPGHTYPDNLEQINIPDSVTNLEGGAFAMCNKINITLGSNSNYSIENNIIYNKEKTHLIEVLGSYNGDKTLTLPETLTSIQNSAFFAVDGIDYVILPNKMEVLGDYALYESSIKGLFVPKNIKKLGQYAVACCRELINIEFEEDSVCEIGDNAFAGCIFIVSAKIPSTMTKFGEKIFQGCESESLIVYGTANSVIETYCAENNYNFSSEKIKIMSKMITVDNYKLTYSPDMELNIVVTYLGKELVKNEDYIVTYDDDYNKEGIHYATISGIGNYIGDVQQYYEVSKAESPFTIDIADVKEGETITPVVNNPTEQTYYWYIYNENGKTVTNPASPGEYTYYISVYSNDYYKGKTITQKVKIIPASIPLESIEAVGQKWMNIYVGDTVKLEFKYNPENTTVVKNPKWSTSDESVLKIDEEGNLTALKTNDGEYGAKANFVYLKVAGKSISWVVYVKEKKFVRGDVNMDEKVNAGDYVAVLNYVRKKITLTDEQLQRADANGDGKINAGDYVTILNIVRGKI